MASETQGPAPSRRRRGARHGRHARASNPLHLHGAPANGAGDAAPTAPHASPPKGADKSGPARFWSTRRLRIVWLIALALSLTAHVLTAPWELLPDDSGVTFKDPNDELTIPIDLLGAEAPPPEPPKETPEPKTEEDPNGPNAKKKHDAGAPLHKPDAGETDGGVHERDGGSFTDAGTRDAGEASADAGLVAHAEAGAPAGASGPQDPGSMVGMAGLVTAGQVNVTLLVNMAVIRTNPIGARMGPLLFALPQWNDFMAGVDPQKSAVDPIRDTDWILIYGPSLINTERDAVLVRYSAPDAVVDQAVLAVSQRYDRGGPFDAGVPGVKASLGHADNAERVFLRAQPHVLAVVPKDKATQFARALKRAAVSPKVRPGEAMRLTVVDPWKQIAIPGLKFDRAVKELRLWIVPRADGGAEVFAEGDCTSEEAAAEVAPALTDVLRRVNSVGVRIATRGLLNDAKVRAEGTHFTLHITATTDQLQAILGFVGAYLGANVEAPAPPR